MINKFPYVVYWHNKKHAKWQCCKSLNKAKRLETMLKLQGVYKIWIALDISY